MTQDIRGLVGVITGGGDGIGRALALELAGEGMHVAILDVRKEAADDVASACRAKGVRALALRCDASITDQIEAAAVTVRAEFRRVNLIWANGGHIFDGGITTAPREELRRIFTVNVDGVIEAVRAFLPGMKSQPGWRWVGITSSMGGLEQVRVGGPSALFATEYATVGIAEGLRAELAIEGIGVTLSCPGAADTGFWSGGQPSLNRAEDIAFAQEECGERWRTSAMNVEQVAAVTVARMREGDFYVLIPRDEKSTRRLDRRHQALRSGIRWIPFR